MIDATPRSADSYRDQVTVDNEDESASDDDDGCGPHRRRLTAKQYEALVRCAQQVVGGAPVP